MSDDARRSASLTFRVMHAVTRSELPPQLRHFVMTLALLADSDTGRAYYGQAAIGRAMGCSDRQVRNYFSELEAHPTSPVRSSNSSARTDGPFL